MDELLKLAPTILGFLGGPAGGLAGAGLQWLAGKLGAKDSTVDAITKALQGWKPDDALALRKLDVDFQEFCLNNGIKVDLAQADINKTEAASTNWFVSGWRPAIGWICGAIFAYSYIVRPLALFFVYWLADAETVKQLSALPDINVTEIMPIMLGMLGLGYMRTHEKVKGVSDTTTD